MRIKETLQEYTQILGLDTIIQKIYNMITYLLIMSMALGEELKQLIILRDFGRNLENQLALIKVSIQKNYNLQKNDPYLLYGNGAERMQISFNN